MIHSTYKGKIMGMPEKSNRGRVVREIHSVYFLTDVASVTNQPLLLLQFLIYTVATSLQ